MTPYQEQVAAAKERLARRRKEQFVGGPIPLPWLSRAFRLPGKCGAVGLAIWWRAGLKRQKSDLTITRAHTMAFGVDSRGGRLAALERLEAEGLIRVSRSPNKAPRVEIVTDAEEETP